MKKTFTSARKQNHENKERNPRKLDLCNTGVYVRWDGRRSPHSWRVNDKLWKAFKSTIEAENDSVCSVLEAMMAVYLGAIRRPVNKRSTQTIVIENLNVQRVVKRHKRVTHVYEEDELTETTGTCHYCKSPPIGLFKYVDGKTYPLCDFHATDFLKGGNWRLA